MFSLLAKPDLLDRTRLAAFAVLAAFAALSLTLVGHLAATGVPLPLPGLPGEGLILSAPEVSSSSSTGTAGQPSSDTGADEALTIGPAIAATPDGAPSQDGDRGGQGTGTQAGAPDTNGGPREVGVSVGSVAPSQPTPATPAPGATSPPTTGTPGTGTSGGSPGDTAGDGTASVPGPENNWGHTPVAPTGSGRTTGAGSSGATASSSSSSSAGATTTSTSKPSSTTKASTTTSGKVTSTSGAKVGSATAPTVKAPSGKPTSPVSTTATSGSPVGGRVKSPLPGPQR